MQKNKYKKAGIGCLSIVFISLFFATYLVNRETKYKEQHPITTGNTVSIILIDGLSQKVFQSAIAQNKLPQLEKLIKKGTYIENGISAFPSMTGYAFYPFITGFDATQSGILGLRWFDRSRDEGNLRNYVGRTNVWMNQDLTDTIQTIFEKSGQMYTASINSYMNRGVDDSRMTGWTHTTAKFEGKSIFGPMRSIPLVGEELAKNHFQHESEVMKMATDQLTNNPKVQWITLPSPDASHHIFGMTDNYLHLLQHIDSLIGDFILAIESLGQADTRMIAIVTDHGVSDVSENIDIVSTAQKQIGLDLIRGNSVNYRSMQLNEKLEAFIEKDGYWVINGNLSSMLYLRDPKLKGKSSWRKNLDFSKLSGYRIGDSIINIPNAFAKLDGIELVIYNKNQTTVRVESKAGIAEIIKIKNQFLYQTITGDPLEYSDLGLIDTLLSSDQWLKYTIKSKYPDAIFRLFTLMKCPVVGDLVITSAEGYDLAKDYEVIVGNYKGGHGGLRSDQLRVPYILSIPGQQNEEIDHLRAEDVGKIILKWLNFD